MADLVKDISWLEGITGLNDESNPRAAHRGDLARTRQRMVILNQLYQYTSAAGIRVECQHAGAGPQSIPKILTLKQMIQKYSGVSGMMR